MVEIPKFSSFACGWLVLAGLLGQAKAAEPWADPRLPVDKGLLLWLDASTLPRATGKKGDELAEVTRWPDASGNGHAFLQPEQDSAPEFTLDSLSTGKSAPRVRFDGQNDVLSCKTLAANATELTVFLVAAPRTNAGGFRAFFSANARGRNDYQTGINLDLGGQGSGQIERLNVEGAGFSGECNLLTSPYPPGEFHVVTMVASAQPPLVAALVDGRRVAGRPRLPAPLTLDEFRLGSRFCQAGAAPAAETGFLSGEIAELIVYKRALNDSERLAVEMYLKDKHADLLAHRPKPGGDPILRMLVGGFTVTELPLALSHVTDLYYAPDGRLFAAGYDGRIHTLHDDNGDGLLDVARPFWDRPTQRTPMAMTWTKDGLAVISNGKLSLLRDSDGDGKADAEEILTSGWVRDVGNTGGGVDAVGLAQDANGDLYFGLGCADYSNPYRLKDGKSHYDLGGERGTIVKWSPSTRKRTIVATGIRFAIGLAFNRHGDLFCTDQEGETWLPGGNPLDELDHIVPGRHYGFPPRHDVYLPNVLDEPPLWGYGPQHQCTTGLTFNERREHWQSFGPSLWEGDAIVSGYSRGKLWRTTLIKTRDGYLAENRLFAVSRMLLVDAVVSPAGDLIVACHEGLPDWGTGPQGAGKYFKISYSGTELPQPVRAFAAGPLQVNVAFDRPLPDSYMTLARRARIAFGEYVRAGDRWEVLKPPYAVVEAQSRSPRRRLAVRDARLSSDRTTLELTTEPHTIRSNYALQLPPLPGSSDAIEVDYTLSGVEARWTPSPGSAGSPWSGWLPHVDSEIWARSKAEFLQQNGVLTLKTTVLPASRERTLLLESSRPFRVTVDGRTIESHRDQTSDQNVVTVSPASEPGESRRLEVAFPTGESSALRASWLTTNGERRPIRFEELSPPWSPTKVMPAPPAAALAPELVGGDWETGRQIFFSKIARCGDCHRKGGLGESIGPDLSNLVHRDAGSILRDIIEPSLVMNPDYIPYAITLSDGKTLSGLLKTDAAGGLVVVDADARSHALAREEIVEIKPTGVSAMPKGLDQAIGANMKHLLAFLQAEQPPAKTETGPKPPPPRQRAEVEAILALSPALTADELQKPLRITLVAGPKDHGPNEHDYPNWQIRWNKLLSQAPGVTVTTAWQWPTPEQWKSSDVVIFYYWNNEWSPGRFSELDQFQNRGGGVIILHSASINDQSPPELARRIGLAYKSGRKTYRHGPLNLDILDKRHPLMNGFVRLDFYDESYWEAIGEITRVNVLATQLEAGKPAPMLWTYHVGEGRVFVSILGHYSWTFDDPYFRIILLRAIAWAAHQPPQRLEHLALEESAIGR